MDQKTLDINELLDCKTELDKSSELVKTAKQKYNNIEAKCAMIMFKLKKRCIDIGGKNNGPFLVLGIKKIEGTMNNERSLDYYGGVLAEISKTGVVPSAEKFLADKQKYASQYQKVKLYIYKTNHVRRRDINDIIEIMKELDCLPIDSS